MIDSTDPELKLILNGVSEALVPAKVLIDNDPATVHSYLTRLRSFTTGMIVTLMLTNQSGEAKLQEVINQAKKGVQ